MKLPKIYIIGAGNVGSTIAYTLTLKNVAAEIILIDINEIRCKGEVLDIADSRIFANDSKISQNHNNKTTDADIIIIAAGKKQEPNQNRIELLSENKKTVIEIIKKIKPINPKAVIIVVTNPLDAITYFVQKESGLPYNQVIGTGTFLDTQRLRGILSERLKIAEQSIHAYVLGEHGDSQFVAWSCAQIAGISLDDFGLSHKDHDTIAQETKNKAYEIISCKGATYFGIATCVAVLCRTIIFDQKRVAPISCYLPNEQLYISMPVILGSKGVEKILRLPLNDTEKKLFQASTDTIRSLLAE